MPDNLLQQATDLFAQRVQQYAQGMAQYIGGPLSGHELSQDEAVQRWNYTPLPSAEAADNQYYNLLQQGMQPGQALQQVYPMRAQLIQGADISSQISRAKQIAGWVADAEGREPPAEYRGNTQILLHQQQQPPPPPPMPMGMPPQGPMPAPPPGMLAGLPPRPPVPMPMPTPAPPPGPMPMPGAPAPVAGPPPMPGPPQGPMPAPPMPMPLPPPATTAPPNAEAPLGGGILPPGQGPTGTIQA